MKMKLNAKESIASAPSLNSVVRMASAYLQDGVVIMKTVTVPFI